MAVMPVPREAVLQHVEKMLASAAFAGAVRSRGLLTFVVQEALDGRAGA